MNSYINLPLSASKVDILSENAKDFAFTKGIAMKYKNLAEETVTYAPFCLLPSPFPRNWFDFAKTLQPTVNDLMLRVANDQHFLKTSLQRTIKSDDFTAKIFQIYETVQKEGEQQKFSLALLRTDYMLNVVSDGTINGIKQVEVNTIASSFAGLSTELAGLHKNTLRQLKVKNCVPENSAVRKLALGLVSAWKVYGNEKAVIVFLVEDVVYNIMDHRHLEQAIYICNENVTVLFLTFQNICQQGEFKDSCMFINGQEVAVVYFRTGYSPEQLDAKDWELRLRIERSKAIKCPSAKFHLAGTKKVQQELSRSNVLERFLKDKTDVENIRETFVQLLPLDLTEEGDAAAALAMKKPEKFVMKPQREGGGNNIYGSDIVKALERIGKSKEREGYILMERIFPPSVSNYIVRRGQDVSMCQAVGELGVYGVILANDSAVIENYEAGHLLRTKAVGTDEGGIAAGYGALDCPYLI